MKILALEKEIAGKTPPDFQPHHKAEALRVYELYLAGLVREIYFRRDETLAVLVLECEDEAEALAALESLPLVEAGLVEFELIPLMPYPGFSRLFDLGTA